MPPAPRGHLVADRFRRVWAIAQHIADAPGLTRTDLAARFNFSERHIQSDLNVIRDGMGLPLVRQQGYRFVDEGGSTSASGLDFLDVLLLVTVMQRRHEGVDREQLAALTGKLVLLAPPHLRPLTARLLDREARRIIEPLTTALLTGGSVCLTMRRQYKTVSALVLTPELIFPYLGEWYALGVTNDGSGHYRVRVVSLTPVVAVEPVAVEPVAVRVVRAAS